MLGVEATMIVTCADRGPRRCDKRPLTDSGRVKRCALRQVDEKFTVRSIEP